MYDSFSNDYDRFVNWTSRLDFELPFIERKLQSLASSKGPARLLDAACGTGMHAIALAKKGYATAGADYSAGMIDRAQANAQVAGARVPFVNAGFGQLAGAFHAHTPELLPFDALLCLGNSLPHLLTAADLAAALADFAACLRPGGLLLIQNRNFDAVLQQRERFMEPQSYREGEGEWIYLRFYDYEPDGLIRFNIITLQRVAQAPWQQQITSTPLYPLRQAELVSALEVAGFGEIEPLGGMNGAPFDPAASGNLVIVARKVPAGKLL
ncbi:MAG: class I SAM-dependent methyltransferase [Chloroflexi bacterium]|nr:MAG: class I SAM-dependent methyltransferase [Chloroflexota bacterium]